MEGMYHPTEGRRKLDRETRETEWRRKRGGVQTRGPSRDPPGPRCTVRCKQSTMNGCMLTTVVTSSGVLGMAAGGNHNGRNVQSCYRVGTMRWGGGVRVGVYRFVHALSVDLARFSERCWSTKRFIVFQAVILQCNRHLSGGQKI